MALEGLITLGYYVSSIGFLIASIMMWLAVKNFGKSALGSIFYYFFVGTSVFFVITVFQKLGAEFFNISDESMDVWWHVMFYLAFIFYFAGVKSLVNLGSSDPSITPMQIGSEKKWGFVALIVLVLIFILPSKLENFVVAYEMSALGTFGLHHFISFALAGVVGWYLASAKKNLGQIGQAIANPMIIAMWALCIQHFWELLTESWAVIQISSENIEGVEKIFLTISAIAVIAAASRLKSYGKV